MCLLNVRFFEGNYPQLYLVINNNPFNCDCKDYSIIARYRAYSGSHQLDRANCEKPDNLYNAKV